MRDADQRGSETGDRLRRPADALSAFIAEASWAITVEVDLDTTDL